MGTPKGTKPWNAGTGKGWIDKRGYRWLYVDENGCRRAKREHRVIMERYLGRRLEPWECVHHRNGNTEDNRTDNLEVKDWSEHSGEHSIGSKRSDQAKAQMRVSARMREDIRHLRKCNARLLEALGKSERIAAEFYAQHPKYGPSVEIVNEALLEIRAAIREAEGEA